MADGGMARLGPDLMLRFTPGTSMTFIDNQPIIVSKDRRMLFEVNQIGGYIGCRLEDGISLRQLAEEVADRGFAPASAMLKAVLAEWSHSGLIYATDRPPASPPAAHQSISLGGMRLALRYHDEAIALRVAPLFAHLESDARSFDVSYDIWPAHGLSLLSRDGGRAAVLHAIEAAPIIKASITQDIIGDCRWSLAMYAGCLERNGRALLLTGRPGAGKTTLISWLLGAGFAYHGDDIAMLRADGRVQGLPFLPTVKSGAWRLMTSRYADLLQPSIHVRPDGKRVRYLAPIASNKQQRLSVGWVVKLRRTKGRAAQLAAMPPTAIIKHLLSEAASATGDIDHPTLRTLIRAIGAAQAWELRYDDLDEAAALLERLCDDGAA